MGGACLPFWWEREKSLHNLIKQAFNMFHGLQLIAGMSICIAAFTEVWKMQPWLKLIRANMNSFCISFGPWRQLVLFESVATFQQS